MQLTSDEQTLDDTHVVCAQFSPGKRPIYLRGSGEMIIDDEIIKVKEGSIVKIQLAAKRSWWNTGDSDLCYIVIQAPVGGMKSSGIDDGELIEGTVLLWSNNLG